MDIATSSISGATLKDIIHGRADGGELGLEELIDVLLKVCEGVSFAHSRGVLHLDLKPDNIMIGSHGQVYVMDWGIAAECARDEHGRLRPRLARTDVRGTLAYMPPEQTSENFDVDERADVYGLGAILYEILCHRPPFKPEGSTKDFKRLRQHSARPPVEIVTDRRLPPGLCEISMRALSRERDQRHPNVDAFKAELEAFRRGGGWFATRAFAAGDVIVRESKPADSAYIITEGRCQVFQMRERERVLLREMGPGDVFGETALLTSGIRTATVVATEPLTALVVTRESLDRELEARGWLGVMLRALAARFRDVDAERARLRSQLGKTTA